jgi:pSer/pThr/pTyr-binding forkhead associated (FHA) protein
MKDQLDRIEYRLQSLIEGSLIALIPSRQTHHNLIHQLVEAMHANQRLSDTGDLLAPNVYTLQVNPERLAYWQADPSLLEEIASQLLKAAGEGGIVFHAPPVIHLVGNPQLTPLDTRVVPYTNPEPIGETTTYSPPAAAPEKSSETIPTNAFLIVNGVTIFPLRQAVVNIGRKLDNHLTIDDPRVSRAHAQLRVINKQYVLFDLNSTGGTYVNGQRITRYNLNPGDVISLAGVALIYGQDEPSPTESLETPASQMQAGSTRSFLSPNPDRNNQDQSQ